MKKIAGRVIYADMNSKEIKEVSLDLLKDVLFKIEVTNKNGEDGVSLSMEDKITSNVELGGFIGVEELEALIKQLSIIKNQLRFEGR